MDTTMVDLKLVAMRIVKHRGFASLMILTLGLPLGLSTTAFVLVNTWLIRDLPDHSPERLVSLGTRDARGRDLPVASYKDLQDWRRTSSIADLAFFTGGTMDLTDDSGTPERLN